MTALAALALLTDATDRTPLPVIVDDVHWLDRPSLDAPAFVARRLGPEPPALPLAGWDGYDTPLDDWGLPDLRLEPLGREAAAALLDATAPVRRPPSGPRC